MSLTFGLKGFAQVVFEIEPEKAPQNPQNQLKYIKIDQILVVFDAKCNRKSFYVTQNQSLSFEKAKHIITNAECNSEFDLVMFDEIALGAPF